MATYSQSPVNFPISFTEIYSIMGSYGWSSYCGLGFINVSINNFTISCLRSSGAYTSPSTYWVAIGAM